MGRGPWEHMGTGKKHLTLGGQVTASESQWWVVSERTLSEVRVSQ